MPYRDKELGKQRAKVRYLEQHEERLAKGRAYYWKVVAPKRERPRQVFFDGNQKSCSKCKEIKPVAEFYPSKTTKQGLMSHCKPCHSNSMDRRKRLAYYKEYRTKYREKMKAMQMLWYQKKSREDPTAWKDRSLRKRYGITLADRDMLKLQQEGLCAICRLPDELGRELHVDHDHATGKVRALLCNNCNAGLGYFRENSEIMVRALTYLTIHTAKEKPLVREN